VAGKGARGHLRGHLGQALAHGHAWLAGRPATAAEQGARERWGSRRGSPYGRLRRSRRRGTPDGGCVGRGDGEHRTAAALATVISAPAGGCIGHSELSTCGRRQALQGALREGRGRASAGELHRPGRTGGVTAERRVSGSRGKGRGRARSRRREKRAHRGRAADTSPTYL
jgi:hypothetical protein